MKTVWVVTAALVVAVLGFAGAARAAFAEAELEAGDAAADLKRDAETAAYDRGTAAIDAGHWGDAIAAFDDVARGGGKRADGGLYWKAYAQNKAGQRPAALATLQALQKGYPQSRWLKEAKALDMELRQASGQAPRPEVESDDDLKLLALNSLMTGDPEKALPMLEKFLASGSSPQLRERALFVLAQTGSPKAREILVKTAKDGSNPELQKKAIEFLALFGGAESRQVLQEMYASTADREVKKVVLHTYLITNDRAKALAAAKGEKDPELRREAIQMLGAMGAHEEVWELYRTETFPEVRKAALQALFIGGAADRISELARTEKDPELRLEAIRTLGLMGRERTGSTLVSLYAAETDVQVKKAVLQGLFVQGNAEAIIDIARKEKDRDLRSEAVGHLSHMNTKASTEFMMEILNK